MFLFVKGWFYSTKICCNPCASVMDVLTDCQEVKLTCNARGVCRGEGLETSCLHLGLGGIPSLKFLKIILIDFRQN